MNAVTQLFLTHPHSDHVIGVPDLMLTPFAIAAGQLSVLPALPVPVLLS